MFPSFFFLLLVLLANRLVVSVQVDNSRQLENELCRNRSGTSLVIQLTGTSYGISLENCTVVFKNANVHITSNETMSSINCITRSQVNFVFENSTAVLHNLKFIGCGALVSPSYINSHNASLKFSNESQNVSLLFVHSSLQTINVTIESYIGYALIGINMWGSNLTGLNVSLGGNYQGASGIVIQYNDDIEKYNKSCKYTYTLTFWNSTFSDNFYMKGYNRSIHYCFYKRYLYSNDKTQEVFPAAGLTILYTQTRYKAQVNIMSNSTFFRNIGIHAGALMIVHYIPLHESQHAQHALNSATIIEDTIFKRNSNYALCSGAAIAFYWIVFSKHTLSNDSNPPLQPLLVNSCTFVKQQPLIEDDNFLESNYTPGNMYIGILPIQEKEMIITITNSTFHQNVAEKRSAMNGACLTAETFDLVQLNKNIKIVLESISADNNYQFGLKKIHDHSFTGIFAFFNLPRVEISGVSKFHSNNGSVIYSEDSNIYLSGNIRFMNNAAVFGPAIRMKGHGQLHFSSGLQALFKNNRAEKLGGALHLQKDSTPFDDRCVMNISCNDDGKDIKFVNNQAVDGGNSIYAYPLYSCYSDYNGDYIHNTSYYDHQMFSFNNSGYSNSLLNISSKPSKLLYNMKKLPTHIHPGTTFEIEVGALFHENFVWANLDNTLQLGNCSKTPEKSCSFLEGMVQLPESAQWHTLKEGHNYTAINITILVKRAFSGDFEVRVASSIYNGEFTHYTGLFVYACPLGFQLSEATGKCDCCESLKNISPYYDIQCDINQLKIKRPDWNIPWIGEYDLDGNNNYTTGVSKTCPVEYCTVDKKYRFFKISDNKQVTLFNPENSTDFKPLCQFNRTGVLCSHCPNGTSVVLGSPDCKHCPPGYTVLTVFIFLLAGPLLIFSLYALQLTLATGTLNGVIFYAQAANAGLVDMLNIHLAGHSSKAVWILGRICITVLSFLNLNLGGFSLCFLGNLSELSKAGFSLLFPIYLLTIIVFLIFLSRFSQKLSNHIAHSSVQVLVTVVHLSFSNLLGRTIKVFSPALIYYDNGMESNSQQVWYYDGAVTYGEPSHLSLMIITLMVAVVFVLPYIMILICARPLRRSPLSSKYLRPFIEAIHAPYKEGKEYWFVTRLIALMIIYILYVYYITVSITKIYASVTPIISSMLFLQAYLKPFKKKLINILDCWIMFLLLIVGIMSWYFLENNNYLGSNIICEVSVFLFLFTFVVVLAYHISWVTGLIDYVQYLGRGFQRRRDERRKTHYSTINGAGSDAERNRLSRDADEFYGSTSYRESLLSSTTSEV